MLSPPQKNLASQFPKRPPHLEGRLNNRKGKKVPPKNPGEKTPNDKENPPRAKISPNSPRGDQERMEEIGPNAP